MTEVCPRSPVVSERSENTLTKQRILESTPRSVPVITILASSPSSTEKITDVVCKDSSSVPIIIIEHVGNLNPENDIKSLGASSQSTNCIQTVYKCEECEYSSHNKHYLKQHIDLVHNPERPYKCPFCDYAGKRSHSLREHLVVHTNERPFECTHCNATFRKKGHLTNHVKLHTTQKMIKCSLCSGHLSDQSSFEDHLQLVHKTDKLYACELCDFVAGDQSRILSHLQSHANDSVYRCSHCAFVSSDVSALAAHAESHKPPLFKPSISNSPVRSPESSGKAMMVKCTECGFTAQDAEKMKSHMWEHIKSAEKEKINISQNTRPSHLQTDIKVVERALPENAAYKCTECSFVSKEATIFIKHMLVHKKIQSVSQPSPMQTFVVAPVSKENTCKNTENAPFTHDPTSGRFRCTICGYTCEYQRTIKAHIWKHSGHQDIDYPMFQNGPLSIYDESSGCKPIPGELSTTSISGSTLPVTSEIKVNHGKIMPVTPMEKVPVRYVGGTIDKNESQTLTASHAPALGQLLRSAGEVNIKLIKADNTPKSLSTTTSLCQMKTVDGKAIAVIKESPTQTGPGKIYSNLTQAIVPVIDKEKLSIKDTTFKQESSQIVSDNKKTLDQGVNLKSASCGPTTSTIKIMSSSSASSYLSKTALPKPTDITAEDTMTQVAKQFCTNKQVDGQPTGGINVVVETVDSVPPTSGFTGMKSQQNSPRIPDAPPSDESEYNDSGVALDVAFAVPDKSCLPVRVDDSWQNSVHKSENCNSQIIREGGTSTTSPEKDFIDKEEEMKGPESSTSETNRQETVGSKKHNESAITLLSLLKKQPYPGLNNEPEDIVVSPKKETVVDSDQEPVSEETASAEEFAGGESSTAKPKTGICSSLLAVIEQLRERSRSESESEDSLFMKGLPGKRHTRKRSRKDSTEDDLPIESIENVEKLKEEDEIRYRCKLCHYSNSRTLLIRLHMRLHKSKKPFECSLCDFIAGSSELLQDHMIRHCKVRTYQCKLCPSAFNYKSQLRAHMRAHNEKDPFICDLCDFETTNPMTYRNHIRFHTDKKSYRCEMCEESFPTRYDLRVHKRDVCSGHKSLECEECDFTAVTKDELKHHIRFHHKELKCSQCDFTCTSVAVFTNHANVHEDAKPLKCEMCDFTAVSSRSLKSHMKRHINDQRYVQQPLEQYKCNLCGYVCHHLPSLKSHMWRHASDRNYSYEFTNDVINAAIDYDCRIDSSSVDDPDLLEKVLNTERKILEGRLNNSVSPDGSMPVCWVVFRCCQCGFETINKAHLNIHMRSHADIIQRTLEVSQGLVRQALESKRVGEESHQNSKSSSSKYIKTQDHG